MEFYVRHLCSTKFEIVKIGYSTVDPDVNYRNVYLKK